MLPLLSQNLGSLFHPDLPFHPSCLLLLLDLLQELLLLCLLQLVESVNTQDKKWRQLLRSTDKGAVVISVKVLSDCGPVSALLYAGLVQLQRSLDSSIHGSSDVMLFGVLYPCGLDVADFPVSVELQDLVPENLLPLPLQDQVV